MTKWPVGWFVVDGQPWHSWNGFDRTRGRESECRICDVRFYCKKIQPGVFCSEECRRQALRERSKTRPDLFSNWTHAEAWLAGLIWADGCLIIQRSSEAPRVALHSTDESIARQASEISGAPFKIALPRDEIRKTLFRIYLGRRSVIDRLVAVGLTPRKSLTGQFPVGIPERVMPSFVRGYFDGDGSVGIYRNKNVKDPAHEGRLTSQFVGSANFLDTLQQVLFAAAGIRPRKLQPKSSIWNLSFNHQDALTLAAYMYADAGPHLPRKAALFRRGATFPRFGGYELPSPWPRALAIE